MIYGGVHVEDITPPAGLPMSGYAARTAPAQGAHDPLTVRALSLGDTALVIADVIGIHQDMSARIRQKCCLQDGNVVVHAMHTHGGPPSMRGRLSVEPDESFLDALESACVTAIDKSVARQQPVTLSFSNAEDPDVARNRRHKDGPLDSTLSSLIVRDINGAVLALLANYACHPVVLGADNLLWTADYPHFVRVALEQAFPEATALFLTGCIGDVNNGHSAHASITQTAQAGRSFSAAKLAGERIAQNILVAKEQKLGTSCHAHDAFLDMMLAPLETQSPAELAADWADQMKSASPGQAALLQYWIAWAEGAALLPHQSITGRISVLNWGGVLLVGMPGEVFSATGIMLRDRYSQNPMLLAGFCEDNPGYIPPSEEYAYGGYEVEEAHRYYGLPASFAKGTAEGILASASNLISVSIAKHR